MVFLDYDLLNVMLIMIVSYDIVLVILGMLGIGDDWVYISSGIWFLLGIEMIVIIIFVEVF